jgi:thiosulfate dehydrogenase
MQTKPAKPLGRFIGALIAAAVVSCAAPAFADDPETDTEVFAMARGGQYYDKWWAVLDADEPKETHPAYTAEGKQKGADTWRCKECHGWDYVGKNGAYAKGSHFSGITGISGMAGADPGVIAAKIRGKPHGYTPEMLPDKAVQRLALFVAKGQIDMDKYIDRATKAAKGDPNRGARFYQTVCANCHGFDGKELNFASAGETEYVGTVAKANPWETLHKIRNGQPGQVMPALVALEMQDLVDILAYTQTLPEK